MRISIIESDPAYIPLVSIFSHLPGQRKKEERFINNLKNIQNKGFIGFPIDIFSEISKFLTADNLVALAGTCITLRSLITRGEFIYQPVLSSHELLRGIRPFPEWLQPYFIDANPSHFATNRARIIRREYDSTYKKTNKWARLFDCCGRVSRISIAMGVIVMLSSTKTDNRDQQSSLLIAGGAIIGFTILIAICLYAAYRSQLHRARNLRQSIEQIGITTPLLEQGIVPNNEHLEHVLPDARVPVDRETPALGSLDRFRGIV